MDGPPRHRLAAIPVQQRAALVSVAVAAVLVAIKLAAGLASASLGLIAEAIHSASDLIAALTTFFALRVALRPADYEHPFGHGRAEQLSALAEGAVLVIASLAIVAEAAGRLAGSAQPVQAHWYALAVPAAAIALDASRWVGSRRVAAAKASPALQANALHFALDMVGSAAVLLGLVMVRAGYQNADAVAALLVAALVLVSAGRLMRGNIQVLMDSAPEEARRRAREAVERVDGARVQRLRMRQAGGQHFADVVIGVSPGTDVAAGHDLASAVEHAIERALPGADVMVHVEPDGSEPASGRGSPGGTLTATIRLRDGTDSQRALALARQIESRLAAEHPEIAEVRVSPHEQS